MGYQENRKHALSSSKENSCSETAKLLRGMRGTYRETLEKKSWVHLTTEEHVSGFLPINSFVIVGAIKKLDLFKGGWTWEVTGDSWVHGQEEVHSCCACNRNQLTGPGSHIMLWLNERFYLHCKKQFPDGHTPLLCG